MENPAATPPISNVIPAGYAALTTEDDVGEYRPDASTGLAPAGRRQIRRRSIDGSNQPPQRLEAEQQAARHLVRSRGCNYVLVRFGSGDNPAP